MYGNDKANSFQGDEMARQLDFYFDCSSPWTYLAFHAIQPLVQEARAVFWPTGCQPIRPSGCA